MSKPLDEKQKLKRALKRQIELRALPRGSEEKKRAIDQLMRDRLQLSPGQIAERQKRWIDLGSPELYSQEWQNELRRLPKPPRGKEPKPPPNAAELTQELLRIATWQSLEQNPTKLAEANEARRAAGLPPLEPVELFELPGQSNYRQTKEQQAAARRLYRWLWRNFPGQLKACPQEIRQLIRRAGGIA